MPFTHIHQMDRRFTDQRGKVVNAQHKVIADAWRATDLCHFFQHWRAQRVPEGVIGDRRKSDLPARGLKGVVDHQAVDQRPPDPGNQLDHFIGLKAANHAGQHPQHPGFCAVGRQRGVRRTIVEITIIGATTALLIQRVEHRDMPLELHDGAIHQRLAAIDTGIVDQVLGGKVVSAIDNDVVIGHKRLGIVEVKALDPGFDLDVGIEFLQTPLGDIGLVLTFIGDAKQHLAVHIGHIDLVGIDNSQPPHPGSRQIKQRRTPQAARSNH